MTDRIAVLIPCYNEEVTIAKVVDDFKRSLPEAAIYVYDNNSTDATAEIARAHGAIVKREPRQGKGNVVRQMFRDIEADYYLMVDGDDTYPAEAARELLAPLIAGEADMTVGDRLSNGSYGEENDRAFHGFGNDLVRWLIKFIYGYAFDDVMTGYRAFNRTFVKTMPVLSSGFQIETEAFHPRRRQALAHRRRADRIPRPPRRKRKQAFHLRRRREGAHGHRLAVPRKQALRLLRVDRVRLLRARPDRRGSRGARVLPDGPCAEVPLDGARDGPRVMRRARDHGGRHPRHRGQKPSQDVELEVYRVQQESMHKHP